MKDKIIKSKTMHKSYTPGEGMRFGTTTYAFDDFEIQWRNERSDEYKVIYQGQEITKMTRTDFNVALDEREKKLKLDFLV